MANEDQDDYFSSYDDLQVHQLMLKDQPRTRAYQHFIESNKTLFEDKIVVDVGAGIGILSLFVARAGAKQVYAVEASGMHKLCREIVHQNGLDDKITVIHSCVEDVTLPDDTKADVIISEWMGFYLLHESMLDSVIKARDRLLTPDGILVPSSASLYLCPVSMTSYYNDNIHFWNSVYGFDFSPVVSHVKQKMLTSPQIELITADQCLAEPECVLNLDLKYVDQEDICKIYSHVKFKLTKNGLLHGLACWFDVEFDGDVPSVLSTGPQSKPTHWKQTVVMLPDALLVNKDEVFECSFLAERSLEHPRRYNISIEVPEDEDLSEDGMDQAASMIVEAMH